MCQESARSKMSGIPPSVQKNPRQTASSPAANPSFRAKILRCRLLQSPVGALPNKRQEAEAGAKAILGIAGEVPAKGFFFVKDAQDKQRDDQQETRQRPPRAQRQRREQQHENRPGIHGMPHEAIGARRNHFLPLHYLDGASGKTVLLHDPQSDQIPGEHDDLGKNRQPKWEARPPEAIVQAGDEQRHKNDPLENANDDSLLPRLFFGLQPALDKLGIALQEIRRGNRHGDEQQSHEDPSLPVTDRAGGNEEKRDDESPGEQGAQNEPRYEAALSGYGFGVLHGEKRIAERKESNLTDGLKGKLDEIAVSEFTNSLGRKSHGLSLHRR